LEDVKPNASGSLHNARKEGHAVKKDQVLYLHAHDLQHVHDQFGLPFQYDRPIQNEMQVEHLGVVRNRDNLIGPWAWLA